MALSVGRASVFAHLTSFVLHISTSALSFPYDRKIKGLLRNGVSSIPIVPQR